jgi:hypothetical protein
MAMTQSQSEAMAQAEMLAMQKALAAKPKTGVAGPEMPVMGRLPELSSKQKLANKKELDAKIRANQPAPKPVQKPLPMPTQKPLPMPTPGTLPSKSANAPIEQVEIYKANKMAAMPQTKIPQANTVPNAQMAAMQKMPQPGTVPPANSMPMAPPSTSGVPAMKRGGRVRGQSEAKFSSGGSVSSASRRGDGCATQGKTRGKFV